MIELLKIAAVFAFMIIAINKKVNVGVTMLVASLFIGLLFGLGISDMSSSAIKALLDPKTLELVGIIVFMTFLGNLMTNLENLKRAVSYLESLVSDLRVVVASIPAFIGLMPMPGGAMLSAPFVKEVGEKLKLSPEENTVVNYWFRHIWEFSIPIYPAIILAPTLVGMPVREFSFMMAPFTLVAMVLGIVLILSKMKCVGSKKGNFSEDIRKLIANVWPVLFVIVAYLFFGVDLLVALIIAIALLLVISRIGAHAIRKIFIESRAIQMGSIVAAVMVFKFVIIQAQAVDAMSAAFTQIGIPPVLIVFFIPFLSGALTGLTIGAIGISFPIIMFALNDGGINTGYLMLAYVGGYLGVMSSPTHLCMVLSKDYFGADMGKFYKLLIPLIASMLAFAILFLFL